MEGQFTGTLLLLLMIVSSIWPIGPLAADCSSDEFRYYVSAGEN